MGDATVRRLEPAEEVFLAARGAKLATEARSTILISGMQALRARGFGARYEAQLAPATHQRLSSLIAGEWVPIALALEHYSAADRLELDVATVEEIGGEVADRVNKSALSMAVKMSKQAGVTPWSAISLAHRIHDLNWRGGGDIAVWKLGPKEARYEMIQQPCASVPYFAASFGGFIRALCGLFCTRAYARRLPERCTSTRLAYRLAWV